MIQKSLLNTKTVWMIFMRMKMAQKLILEMFFRQNFYENILVYNISYKAPTVPKLLSIRFHKIDGFIMVLDGEIKHLVLFDYEFLDKICDKIKCLISKKGGITNTINYNFGRNTSLMVSDLRTKIKGSRFDSGC